MEPKQQPENIKALPDAHTDFVFSVSVEWLPTLAVLAALALVAILAIRWIRARLGS